MASIPHPAPTPRQTRRVPRAAGVLVAAIVIVAVTYGVGQVRDPAGPGHAGPRPGDRRAGRCRTRCRARRRCPGAAANGGATLAPDASLATIDHNIGLWTKNLAANDRDYISATNLATLYHGRGRLTADLGDHQRALEAATTAIADRPDLHTGTGPRRRRSCSRSTTSPGPSTPPRPSSRRIPSDLGALATRFDAEIELGRIDDATADLAVAVRWRRPAPADRCPRRPARSR